jgi:hypothetical protein
LNGDVGGGFKVFKLLGSFMARKWYYKRTSTLLNCDWRFSNGSSYVFAGWFHYHKTKLEWFSECRVDVKSPFSWLLGLGSLAWWAPIHVSLPINKLLDVGVEAKFHFH